MPKQNDTFQTITNDELATCTGGFGVQDSPAAQAHITRSQISNASNSAANLQRSGGPGGGGSGGNLVPLN